MKQQQFVLCGLYDSPNGIGKLMYYNCIDEIAVVRCGHYDFWVCPKDLEQIPITPEILTKIGFEQRCEGVFTLLDDYFDLTISEYNDGLFKAVYHDYDMPDQRLLICYVDELQRFFTDCGIEKDIEL